MKKNEVRDKDIAITVVIVLLILWYLLSGCKAKTIYVPVQSTTTITETIRDTVLDVRLQVFRDSVTVSDTVSRLDNKYAYSAAVWSSGRLSHTLGVKDVKIPVEIQYKEITRVDSLAVPYPVVEEVIVYRLKWFQEALMWLGVILLVVAGLKVAHMILKAKKIL